MIDRTIASRIAYLRQRSLDSLKFNMPCAVEPSEILALCDAYERIEARTALTVTEAVTIALVRDHQRAWNEMLRDGMAMADDTRDRAFEADNDIDSLIDVLDRLTSAESDGKP